MAKQLSDRAIGRSDISEYLKSEDDFAFELEILRSCQVGGFEAGMAGHTKILLREKIVNLISD